MQVKQLLEQQFPGIEVVGSTYPLSAGRRALSQAVGAAQMTALGVVFFGERLFEAMGLPAPPPWYARVQQSKPTWALGVWLAGNMASGSLSSSGAFEVYHAGRLMFSKLETGRLPTQREWDALTADVHSAILQSPAARERLLQRALAGAAKPALEA